MAWSTPKKSLWCINDNLSLTFFKLSVDCQKPCALVRSKSRLCASPVTLQLLRWLALQLHWWQGHEAPCRGPSMCARSLVGVVQEILLECMVFQGQQAGDSVEKCFCMCRQPQVCPVSEKKHGRLSLTSIPGALRYVFLPCLDRDTQVGLSMTCPHPHHPILQTLRVPPCLSRREGLGSVWGLHSLCSGNQLFFLMFFQKHWLHLVKGHGMETGRYCHLCSPLGPDTNTAQTRSSEGVWVQDLCQDPDQVRYPKSPLPVSCALP